MGKAISKGLRSKADFLLKEVPEKFGTNFEKNKTVLSELQIPFTKVNRNLVAGYLARKLKQKSQ